MGAKSKFLQIFLARLLKKNQFTKVIILGLAVFFIVKKDISITFNSEGFNSEYEIATSASLTTEVKSVENPKAQRVNYNTEEEVNTVKTEALSISSSLANTYSNLTFSNQKFATKDSEPVKKAKREKQQDYVKRFAKVAQGEMKKYGIPASITLAQGLIESNCGESKLATHNNNHFGIKCFSKTCEKGHCSNFTDDTHKDFFRKYSTAWESFRAHSLLLQKDRYKPLYKLSSSDYKQWAKGLKKAGYATDPHYADKLIDLIEELQL
ncbi:MAG: glucosaminidase domain-containing protein [Saprospiraceae bacterium]|nr:glucosaminidase domain-containing protein [Saprospiraceae bacterium]